MASASTAGRSRSPSGIGVRAVGKKKRLQEDELDLEPQPRVQRLNRLAILLAAALGIMVLWVAYYVLMSREPLTSTAATKATQRIEAEQAAIDRLERRALSPRRRPPARPLLEQPHTQEVSPRPASPPDPSAGRARQQLERAHGSNVLVPGFGQDLPTPFGKTGPAGLLPGGLARSALQDLLPGAPESLLGAAPPKDGRTVITPRTFSSEHASERADGSQRVSIDRPRPSCCSRAL